MARNRKYRYYACDFETTVYDGQETTEVWSSALVELYTENVIVHNRISDTFDYFKSLHTNVVLYYHNLKFDGNFWLYYLFNDLGMKQALTKTGKSETDLAWLKPSDMLPDTFQYSISDRGQWYGIKIKVGRCIIEIRDSLKLLPFSLKSIGKSFKTKHQKLEMEYKGFRYSGMEISEKDMPYIRNDVLVLKEALEIMFNQGHNKLTIGSCCLSEYKRILGKDYEYLFPNVYEESIDKCKYGESDIGSYIRHSYKGGWCYLAKGKENKVYNKGVTADVNSLYPSMMSSESGNYYPIGYPTFWKGDYIPKEATLNNRYYFIRIRTRFYIKNNKLPFIQIKGNWLYKGTEMLETSDTYNAETNEYCSFYKDLDGNIKKTTVELTLTMTDYILFREHYNVYDFEILDGCFFETRIGIFDEYIEKYKKQKLESEGAMKTLAKLFLNNLYGKMASNTDSSFKVAYMKEDKTIGFYSIDSDDKIPGYIPAGSAITSYARNFTIRAAQKNYNNFIYADTDSIHCNTEPDKLVGVPVHEKNFCNWKLESYWDNAIFTRQKTYIEHVTHEDGHKIETPYYNIKCAGMPETCKKLFLISMGETVPEDNTKYSEKELEFLKTKRTINDFKVGLKVPGKLMPKRIRGGILLVPTDYQMR